MTKRTCLFGDCSKAATKRRLCDTHYTVVRLAGNLDDYRPLRDDEKIKRETRLCSIAGCSAKHKGLGYCRSHLLRFKKYGDPLVNHDFTVDPSMTFANGLGAPTESGCIEWQKSKNSRGYGKFKTGGKTVSAHRFSYEAHNGPIPDGAVVRHACDNPPCVNPDHLLVGTHADNSMDAVTRNRVARGERDGNAKLTAADVTEIVKLLPHNARADIARMFNVSASTIDAIYYGRVWGWLTGRGRAVEPEGSRPAQAAGRSCTPNTSADSGTRTS